MRIKKKPEPEKTPEELALERRVDALMDPKKPDETPDETVLPPAAKKLAAKTPEASNSTKTAPKLSPKLRKQIGAADVPAKPLSIDKLDELTESIAEPGDSEKKQAPESPETIQQADITEQSTELDDSQTDEAVDDIVAYEGDVMLAIADSTAAERNRQAQADSGQKGEHHGFATLFWTIIFIIVVVAIVFCVLLVSGGNLAISR